MNEAVCNLKPSVNADVCHPVLIAFMCIVIALQGWWLRHSDKSLSDCRLQWPAVFLLPDTLSTSSEVSCGQL